MKVNFTICDQLLLAGWGNSDIDDTLNNLKCLAEMACDYAMRFHLYVLIMKIIAGAEEEYPAVYEQAVKNAEHFHNALLEKFRSRFRIDDDQLDKLGHMEWGSLLLVMNEPEWNRYTFELKDYDTDTLYGMGANRVLETWYADHQQYCACGETFPIFGKENFWDKDIEDVYPELEDDETEVENND